MIKKNNEIMIKKDCFAYKKGRCIALEHMYCKTEKCSFYQNKEEEEKRNIRKLSSKYYYNQDDDINIDEEY